MYYEIILREFYESKKILNDFIKNKNNIFSIEKAAKLISQTFKNGGKVIACGNGGSNCDAMHFSEELIGKYRKKRIGYPAISISDSSYFSCVSNDFGYEEVFSRYIDTVGNMGDILLSISTSGNSVNIIKAIESANKKNIYTITLTGNNGGKISSKSDIEICVPNFRYSDRIQEMHIKIIHILILLIEIEMSNK